MLRVRLLGSFEIEAGRKPVSLASRPAQSLFAFLVLNAGTAFRREKLAGQLWPDSTEEQARDYLRHALWRIRKALQAASAAPYLRADDLAVAFDSSAPYWLDVAAIRDVSDEAPAEELITALSGYRGEMLPGFYDEWVVLERENLQAAYERKMACLLERLKERGRWSEVLRWGEQWISSGQRPEAAYRYLMEAHAASGDMSGVAAVYERCVKSLSELNVEPSDQTRRLFQELKAGKTRVAQPIPVVKSSRSTAANLPVPLTSFIGRDRETAEITKLLQSQRLVTLVGPGGVGKTRLAIKCASECLPRYADGVFWIPLVGLSDGALIWDEISKALKLRERGGESAMDAVRDHLRTRRALLVLDNCEHLIGASTGVAQDLLAACSALHILATSRERLGLFNETPWQVPSLSEIASLQLFAERGAASRPGFVVDDRNRGSALQICARLDGMPLAIELAAARLSLLSVQEIAARLDDRFALLTAGSRDALPRHQTLRAAIDWSYDLLAADEQRLLNRLSVFAGGFTLEAAEQVAADAELPAPAVLTALGHLVDKSLVVAASSGSGETRYHLLETIRQYAAERLEAAREAGSTRDRHLAYFQHLAARIEPALYLEHQGTWFEQLDLEIDNLRGALQWSSSGGVAGEAPDRERIALGLRLAGGLGTFWDRRHRQESIQRLREMLSNAGPSSDATAWASMALGFLLWASTEHEAARTCLEETVRTAEQFGDPYVIAWSRGYLGAVLVALGEYESASGHLEAAKELATRLGGRGTSIVIWVDGFLGDIPFARGDNEVARQFYRHALAEAERAGDMNSVTLSSRRLGYLAVQEGKFDEAEACFLLSLETNQNIGHLQGINRCVAAFAGLRAAQRRSVEAVHLCAAVEAFMRQTSASFFHWDEAFFEEVLAGLRRELPEPEFFRAWNEGAQMSLEQAVALATGRGG